MTTGTHTNLNAKSKERLKPVFHFTRIVAKRSVFLCFTSTRAELMILTQKEMLRYVTIRLKLKTALERGKCRLIEARGGI